MVVVKIDFDTAQSEPTKVCVTYMYLHAVPPTGDTPSLRYNLRHEASAVQPGDRILSVNGEKALQKGALRLEEETGQGKPWNGRSGLCQSRRLQVSNYSSVGFRRDL